MEAGKFFARWTLFGVGKLAMSRYHPLDSIGDYAFFRWHRCCYNNLVNNKYNSELANDRILRELPVDVTSDLIEGYDLGYQSANAELIEESARLAEGTTLAKADAKTTGKWEVCQHKNGFNLWVIADDRIVCTVAGTSGTEAETKANAALIAAAPELLAHMEKAVDPSAFETWGPEDWEVWNDKAVSLIQKAKVGGAS